MDGGCVNDDAEVNENDEDDENEDDDDECWQCLAHNQFKLFDNLRTFVKDNDEIVSVLQEGSTQIHRRSKCKCFPYSKWHFAHAE